MNCHRRRENDGEVEKNEKNIILNGSHAKYETETNHIWRTEEYKIEILEVNGDDWSGAIFCCSEKKLKTCVCMCRCVFDGGNESVRIGQTRQKCVGFFL